MSELIGSDPLALLALESGLIRGPLEDTGAQGDSKLDTQQRAAAIGEPVPIVFGKRVGDYGGVLISPAATEARFSNDASNAVTASYHLVLSEGQIGSIQVRDVFQRSCRVGSHSQTYNRRAGTWTPGNFISAQAGYTMPECPYYCGTVGLYTGMSTLSFTVTVPNGVDQWNRQVHCFIRNGMEVPRLIEGSVGSSNNFADLVNWSLVNCARLPSSLIDSASLTAAANFLSTNNLTCDINITKSNNLEDFIARAAPYFLLAQTRNDGKRGMRSLLPLNANYTIKTTAIAWEFLFNEDYILPGSFELSYIPLSDRKPFVVQSIWRQQLTDDFGIIRTSEVRYQNEAADGPYEQHDLSEFCTREDHAVKVAAYIRSRRKWITHTARWVSRSQDFNPTLVPGDICRVRLERNVAGMTPGVHDYLYQVDRITKTMEGDVQIEATHFPIDEQGRSLVALDVAGTTGSGILLSSNKSGVGCDVNSSGDTTVPAETWTAGSAIDGGDIPMPPVPPPLPPGGASPADSPADGPDDTAENPDDALDKGEFERLTRNSETCEIVAPPCTNGIWTVTQINDNGDPIPGTSLTYANTLPLNISIDHKLIEWSCADNPALNVQSLQGPDTCNPSNPVPPPNPAGFYGWRAYVWMGGGLSYLGSTGPLIWQSDNPLIVLRVTNYIPYPSEVVDWKINWQLNFTAALGTGTVFNIGLYNTQTGYYPPGQRLIGFPGGAVGSVHPFIYGHINFYPTQADYVADIPQTVLTWAGA